MKQVPDTVNLRDVFADHKFGGARIRPVRMDAAMTGQLTRDVTPDGKPALGIKMVWTLLIEERKETAGGHNTYTPVVTLVAEADEGLPKLLRDVAELIERGETAVTKHAER